MRKNNYDDLKKLFTYDEFKERDVNNKLGEIITEIVNGPAYRDFTCRTVKGIAKIQREVENAKADLINKICDYLKKGKFAENTFEKFHSEACNSFIEIINNSNEYKIKIEYGKAQKILNMTFKYLYVIDKNQKFKDVYQYCHMPIDSYILKWFKNNISNEIIVKGECEKTEKISDISWSNLLEEEYNSIQQEIKNYLNSENCILYKGLNRFEAEFYIWREQQIYELINLLIPKDDEKYEWDIFGDKEITMELKNAIDIFKKIKNKDAFKQFAAKKEH